MTTADGRTPVLLRVPIEHADRTTAIRYPAASGASSAALLVLAHGAGAGQQHPFIVAFGHGLAAAGIDVVTFNFLYAEQKRRVPNRAPVLERCFRRVIETVREVDELHSARLFIGGKSMGGRVATHLAAEGVVNLSGVIVLGYPLHPPGRPEQQRAAHLPAITVPVLIVQGERDTFGTPSELTPVIDAMQAPVTLHAVPNGDHSLAVRGQPRDHVYRLVFTTIGDWIRERS